jgi:DNA-binding CsgD family transcriptional regulator/tetratricopeptide (TPR) repeat protein
MTTGTDLDLARAAFDRRAWSEAAERLRTADAVAALGTADLERLAAAHHMLGQPDDAARAWERAHLAALHASEITRAVRNAFELVQLFAQRGDWSQAGGWLGRTTRLLEQTPEDAVERNLPLVAAALRARGEGDYETALGIFERLAALAQQRDDPELKAMSCLGLGQALVDVGQIERGLGLLDEALVAVTAGEVSPMNAGIVYCGSIESFQQAFDLRRAQEWTAALDRWFETQPDAVPYRGRCLVFRAEILQFHGRWTDAVAEVGRAHDWLSRPPPDPAVGEAYYHRGELHRLRGELAEAEADYREGSRWGRRPDPGLALLRLAQGERAAAAATIRRALDEADQTQRPRLFEAAALVELANDQVDGARAAATALSDLVAAGPPMPLLEAIATRTEGLVRLAAGDIRGALSVLRRASTQWRALDAPYEVAVVRRAIGQACLALGDADAAALEFEAAREVFFELGATPDVAAVDALIGTPPPTPGGLSPREVEVLGHLARGGSNREIATVLGISERTVDRHVSNIYTKLDVSSRAAATAFAYEHDLI